MRKLVTITILRPTGHVHRAHAATCSPTSSTPLAAVVDHIPPKGQQTIRYCGLWEGLVNLPPPPDPPFGIDTIEPIDPPWPAIREWIPADDADPQAVYPEDILSTHWVPTEIRLDDERIFVLDPS